LSERRYGRRWSALRDRILQERDWTCERCGTQSFFSIHVHHKTYERFGEETDADLEVLCRKCHVAHHFSEGREVGGVGFEPTQREAPGLQPGPALQLRRPPVVVKGYTLSLVPPLVAGNCLASSLVSLRLGFEPPFPESVAAEQPDRQRSGKGPSE
jgi:HNH endonuclease